MDKRCYRKVNVLLRVVFPVFIMSLLGAGCASYTAQTQKVSQSWDMGNFQAAAIQITQEADKRGNSKDAIIWRLEQGAVLRAAERFEESNQAFDKAEELINKYEEAAKMSVSREALATVTNLTTLPYEGFAYDKIMMNTYKALNYLQMGDSEKARVEFNRAFQRQDDAVHINTKRIEKAIEEGNKQNYNVDLAKVNRDGKFKSQFDNYYGDLDQFKAYAVYVNPLTVYLDGLYFMTHATGGSDLEHSRKSFDRVLGMIGENKYIRQDMETLQQVVNGKPIPATTYVFFETGQAPEREQIRIDLPLFIITPGVPYVGAAFPKLKYRGDYLSALNVFHDGKTEAALLLSNMDAVVAREFKNELPTIITKTLIASAIKAGATYGAYAGATNGGKKNTGVGLAVLIAGTIYQVAMNQADLRTWTTLPKEFHFCRIHTPSDRKIELEPPYSGRKTPVIIYEGGVNVVWAKSVNRNSPLLVTQFKLKDEVKTIASSETTTAVQHIPQTDVPRPEQIAQQPESLTLRTETQREASESPAQPIHENEAIAPVLENQPETSMPSQQIPGDKAKTSVNTEIPLDTALRLELERILAMDEAKKRQIISLQTEGVNAMKRRDRNAALQAFKKTLEIDSENYAANTNIGGIYTVLNDFDQSLQYLSKAHQIMPASPAPYVNMVYSYARKGDKDRAFESLQKAVDRGFKDINHIKNDTDLPEDFRNDPRLNNFIK